MTLEQAATRNQRCCCGVVLDDCQICPEEYPLAGKAALADVAGQTRCLGVEEASDLRKAGPFQHSAEHTCCPDNAGCAGCENDSLSLLAAAFLESFPFSMAPFPPETCSVLADGQAFPHQSPCESSQSHHHCRHLPQLQARSLTSSFECLRLSALSTLPTCSTESWPETARFQRLLLVLQHRKAVPLCPAHPSQSLSFCLLRHTPSYPDRPPQTVDPLIPRSAALQPPQTQLPPRAEGDCQQLRALGEILLSLTSSTALPWTPSPLPLPHLSGSAASSLPDWRATSLKSPHRLPSHWHTFSSSSATPTVSSAPVPYC